MLETAPANGPALEKLLRPLAPPAAAGQRREMGGHGMFLWGALVVRWVDNLVRPLVISGATRIPYLLVMFGVLGGLTTFGFVGLSSAR